MQLWFPEMSWKSVSGHVALVPYILLNMICTTLPFPFRGTYFDVLGSTGFNLQVPNTELLQWGLFWESSKQFGASAPQPLDRATGCA